MHTFKSWSDLLSKHIVWCILGKDVAKKTLSRIHTAYSEDSAYILFVFCFNFFQLRLRLCSMTDKVLSEKLIASVCFNYLYA